MSRRSGEQTARLIRLTTAIQYISVPVRNTGKTILKHGIKVHKNPLSGRVNEISKVHRESFESDK